MLLIQESGEGVYRVLVQTPDGKGWENVKMDLQEVAWWGVIHWIDLARDRSRWQALVSGNEPLGSMKCR